MADEQFQPSWFPDGWPIPTIGGLEILRSQFGFLSSDEEDRIRFTMFDVHEGKGHAIILAALGVLEAGWLVATSVQCTLYFRDGEEVPSCVPGDRTTWPAVAYGDWLASAIWDFGSSTMRTMVSGQAGSDLLTIQKITPKPALLTRAEVEADLTTDDADEEPKDEESARDE